MKKIGLLLIFSLVILGQTIGQKQIDSYQNEYFGKTMSIKASKPNTNDEFRLYLEQVSLDNAVSEANYIIDSKILYDLTTALENIKMEYINLNNEALASQTTKVQKVLDVEMPTVGAAFMINEKWHFDFEVELKVRYKITNGKKLIIISNQENLTSKSVAGVSTDRVYLVFKNPEEITVLLSKISKGNVMNHFLSEQRMGGGMN